jgi:hypothetical protein
VRTAVNIIEACCLALALGACAAANTPQQNLAYERREKCRAPYTQLEDVGLDGSISFMVTFSR